MNRHAIRLAATLVLLTAERVAADEAEERIVAAEMRKLEGTWEVVSIEAWGMKADHGKGAPDKAIIKDSKATFFAEGKEMPTFRNLSIKLDPKKKPKAIDLVRDEKEILPCIYEVTSDELRLAMPLARKKGVPGPPLARPESFRTKDKPFLVLTAKRRLPMATKSKSRLTSRGSRVPGS